MDREAYQRYLASREWAVLKLRVRARSKGVCERCRQRPHQETHHVTYARVGAEHLEDLLGVCTPCHKFLSGLLDADPAAPAWKASWDEVKRMLEAFEAQSWKTTAAERDRFVELVQDAVLEPDPLTGSVHIYLILTWLLTGTRPT